MYPGPDHFHFSGNEFRYGSLDATYGQAAPASYSALNTPAPPTNSTSLDYATLSSNIHVLMNHNTGEELRFSPGPDPEDENDVNIPTVVRQNRMLKSKLEGELKAYTDIVKEFSGTFRSVTSKLDDHKRRRLVAALNGTKPPSGEVNDFSEESSHVDAVSAYAEGVFFCESEWIQRLKEEDDQAETCIDPERVANGQDRDQQEAPVSRHCQWRINSGHQGFNPLALPLAGPSSCCWQDHRKRHLDHNWYCRELLTKDAQKEWEELRLCKDD